MKKNVLFFFFFSFFLNPHPNMFIDFRERGRDREMERNIDVREKHQSLASCMCSDWGPNPQPKHVP